MNNTNVVNMEKLARGNVRGITPYVAGKPVEETKRELGLKRVIKLASNENPLGPSPKALAAIKKAAGGVNRYPDSNGFYLKRAIASRLKCGEKNIVLGNGSDELIDVIIKTFVEDGENIITADVTFVEYRIIASVYGRKVITVPLKDFKYDVDGILRAVTSGTKLIFIANPNNPTGTYVNKPDLARLMAALPERVILVLDEAYDTYIDVKDYPNGHDYYRSRPLIVLKTFSKAYGLAGLRVGFALADDRLCAVMEKTRQPFNVNLLAQSAAAAALDDAAFLQKSRTLVIEGKHYLYKELTRLGLPYIPSVANFVLFSTPVDGAEVFKKMLARGVIIRDMKQYRLDNYLRVTVGTEQENRLFIRALAQVLKTKGANAT